MGLGHLAQLGEARQSLRHRLNLPTSAGCFERNHDLIQGLQVIHPIDGLQLQRAKYWGQRVRPDFL